MVEILAVLFLVLGLGALASAVLLLARESGAGERRTSTDPYRAGLDAAARISAAAFEAEHSMLGAAEHAEREEE